jgi:lipopolysaccharide/colanic/teichoic acid biosynthesis glycosyltransferase
MSESAYQRKSIQRCVKRLADVLVAATAIVALSPVLIVLSVAVRIRMGSPVLFRQQRPGKDAQPFTMVKFRTMLDAIDADGTPLPDEHRLTRLGKLLRRTSLDELPELLNVLAGHMSIVGPRPLLMRYLPRYTPDQARRHEARPGITGWAQVNGRNALTWEEKFRHDVWYVDHWSLWLDVRILLKTFGQVLTGSGVSAAGHATMPEFMGTESTDEPSPPADAD